MYTKVLCPHSHFSIQLIPPPATHPSHVTNLIMEFIRRSRMTRIFIARLMTIPYIKVTGKQAETLIVIIVASIIMVMSLAKLEYLNSKFHGLVPDIRGGPKSAWYTLFANAHILVMFHVTLSAIIVLFPVHG